VTTDRCERTLVTLLGDIGPWRERIYLAGGLAPRYIVGHLPEGARPHVGTTDVDLVIGLALDEAPETYRTLENNLKKSGFKDETSFRWVRIVEGVTMMVEFLCETDAVEPGRIFKPKGEGTGSGLGAFNVRGAQLLAGDFLEREIEAERLNDGGRSRVTLRVANILSYTVLKVFAFQDRHENKDAYDLVFCLLNYGDDPEDAGRVASESPVVGNATVAEALDLLAQRFRDVDQDGPAAYATFLSDPDDPAEAARLRQEAVVVVRAFLASYGSGDVRRS
jgi:predicted nucleotidyltransferase